MLIVRSLAFLFIGLILAVSAESFAQSTPASPQANAPSGQTQSPAASFIQNLGDNAISIIADKSLSPQQRDAKYGDLLRTAFDIPAIGHFVLGRAWESATPPQRQEFMTLFEKLVVKMYGARLNLYSGESFKVENMRPEGNQEFVVTSAITHPQGAPPTEIDWRVHNDNGRPAVIDVSVAGVSQSLTQRQEYAAILERNNGNFDALLNLMRQRLQQPSKGSQD